ncbi:hypothetical protein [Hymenobacter crusticola]|uniref:Uncharacterized protein n=1 Tax=Hymenobacter crusticola TaxID=1770526 RepID=A0A243W526_9BACT|nr:hypothetical protein [Hymenobacter crusticola]OUJ67760.1 hypothetical protein BXP70_28590 [Hymenobacter crusticola]
MNRPAKKRFGESTLSQPSTPTPDQLMFPSLNAAVPPEVPAPSVAEPVLDKDRWVAFGSYTRLGTYLQLKQAEFWEPGFEIREFVEQALQAALAQLPSAQKELPPHVLDKLLKTNRKLSPK